MVKKRCSNCGKDLEEEWNFCPKCGEKQKKSIFGNLGKIFKLASPGKSPKSLNIKINKSSGRPRIEVRGFGREIPVKSKKPKRKKKIKKKNKKPQKIPESVEEPETQVKNLGNKKIIEVKLPDVKARDVEVNELEESIEIRAFSGDKLYFKVIPIFPNYSLNKDFSDNTLKLEVID